MEQALQFLVDHGYLFLFLFVVAEQIGLPTPALPVMLGAGALARRGELDFGILIVVSVVASLISDAIWYELGRRRGGSVLSGLCRLSLEPDSCVRRTGELFGRRGPLALLVAKFVPGLNTAAPPMAGTLGMLWPRFLLLDSLAALLWSVVLIGAGYLFGDQLEQLIERLTGFGTVFVIVAVAGLAAYVTFKFVKRRRVLRELSIPRHSVEELRRSIDEGSPPLVIDLRHRVEVESDPQSIPGALHLPVEEIDAALPTIPLDREIVFFCT